MSDPLIATVGSINMDLAVSTPTVPARGENLLAHSLTVGLGGKGSNPAVALARMGARSVLVGCVGADDFGRQAVDLLAAEGVDTCAVTSSADAETGVALIMVDDEGENTILVVIGANAVITPESVQRGLDPYAQDLAAIIVNFEVPESCVARAVGYGREHRIPVVVDAGPPRTYADESWSECAVLSPNALEAEMLVGYPLHSQGETVRAARDLLSRGPEAVVLKLGARGAFVCTRAQEQMVEPFRVPVVDTTGAGDAFTAGLAYRLALGDPLVEAVRFANATGAAAITKLGAVQAMPTLVQIERILAVDS